MATVMKLTCGYCKEPFERKVYPSWVIRGYYRYCSMSCASSAGWETRKGTRKITSRRAITNHGHPLANGQGKVLEYRAILYDRIGPGSHKCHWCPNLVEWVNRHQDGLGAGSSHGELAVDHLDGDMFNNSSENLVPACNKCNTLRGLMMAWMERTGLPLDALFG